MTFWAFCNAHVVLAWAILAGAFILTNTALEGTLTLIYNWHRARFVMRLVASGIKKTDAGMAAERTLRAP
jgi:hypothetical protein